MTSPAGSGDLASDVSRLRIQREAEPEPHRGRGRLVVGLLVLIVLAVGGLVAWKLVAGSRPIAVATMVVLGPDVGGGQGTVLTASGYIVARRKAGVGPKVAGLLEYLGVEEGSKVEKGQIIGRLQHRDVSAATDAARSVLEEARANLVEAESVRVQVRKELDRARALLAGGVVSQADFDVAEARALAQEARVRSHGAAVTTAQARLRSAEVALEDTNIRAPFSGTVLTKDSEEGETVAPAAAGRPSSRGSIVTMADLASLEAEVDVNESYIARLREGQPSRIVADSFPEKVYAGKVRQVIPTADRQKATVQVKVAILEPGELLRPDMSVKVTFLDPSGASAAAAPAHPLPRVSSRALVLGPDGIRRAWVVEQDTVRPVRVDVAREASGHSEVRSGLSGGETVVVDPPADLAEGRRIRVKP